MLFLSYFNFFFFCHSILGCLRFMNNSLIQFLDYNDYINNNPYHKMARSSTIFYFVVILANRFLMHGETE